MGFVLGAWLSGLGATFQRASPRRAWEPYCGQAPLPGASFAGVTKLGLNGSLRVSGVLQPGGSYQPCFIMLTYSTVCCIVPFLWFRGSYQDYDFAWLGRGLEGLPHALGLPTAAPDRYRVQLAEGRFLRTQCRDPRHKQKEPGH